jgi:hypothetical protein
MRAGEVQEQGAQSGRGRARGWVGTRAAAGKSRRRGYAVEVGDVTRAGGGGLVC